MRANSPGRYDSFFKLFFLTFVIIKAGTNSKVKTKIGDRRLRRANTAACVYAAYGGFYINVAFD